MSVYYGRMPVLIAIVAALLALVALPASPADAQQVRIETTRKPSERETRVVPPPLHYETSRPPDADFYPRGTRVRARPPLLCAVGASSSSAVMPRREFWPARPRG